MSQCCLSNMTIGRQSYGSFFKSRESAHPSPGQAKERFLELLPRAVTLKGTVAGTNDPAGRRRTAPLQIDRFYRGSRTQVSFCTERFRQAALQRLPTQTPILEHFLHCLLHSRLRAYAACTTGSSTGTYLIRSRIFGQSIKRRRPSMSSTSDVQLSTQSPSLQYRIPSISRISA